MSPFRPSVEALDARALPSAVLASPDDPAGVPATVRVAADPAVGDSADQGIVLPVKPASGTAGKVTLRDFNFQTVASKHSP